MRVLMVPSIPALLKAQSRPPYVFTQAKNKASISPGLDMSACTNVAPPAPGGFRQFDGFLAPTDSSAGDHDLGAFAREGYSRITAQAGRAAGYQRHLGFKTSAQLSFSLVRLSSA
jgi:hypothetical protein